LSHHKIEARDLSFSYPDGTKVLEEVNFLIGHGESVGLLGANGAGKSTLLLLLMGVLFAQKGGIYIADVRLDPKNLPKIRPHLGLVFQNSEEQLFMNTVYEDVAFGPLNMGMDAASADARVRLTLARTGIAHLKDRPPYRCSGGEKRAAAIATVLAMEPDILIMDEPTNGLDPAARRNMINLLNSFQHTKIIAGHDIDMIYEVCGRVIVLQNGLIKADGNAAEILTDANQMCAYGLEPPLFMHRAEPYKLAPHYRFSE
jgi:cobalt/nickel transport system ATP-binding protein